MDISDLVEYTFGYNEFSKQSNMTKYMALGKLVLNLLVTEPNTIPSVPELGVGINLYRMEFNNAETHNEIKQSIREQINKYLPAFKSYIKDIQIEKIPDKHLNGGGSGIYIGLVLDEVNAETGDDILVVCSNINNGINAKVKTAFTVI